MDKIRSISFIGAGNVATHLGKVFFKSGFQIKEVWSNHKENSHVLSQVLNARSCLQIEDISTDVDLVIISVKDDVLETVIKKLPKQIRNVVHTSGSLEMQLLNGSAANYGVFYPLQSFNKTEEIDFLDLPICIESSNDRFGALLFELGKTISSHIEYVNSTQRAYLHIAAVIANNFSNYMFAVSYDLVTEKKLPFNLLIPLIRNTALRLKNEDPFLKQTGPAKRNDHELIQKQLDLLRYHPELKELYQFISDRIIQKEQTK